MGLVDYSDSESEGDAPVASSVKPQPAAAASSTSKKPFQKLVDRSNPGKILVSLPQATPKGDEPNEGPAPKRIKTGGGRFSGFSSFLPPPKTTGKLAAAAPSNSTDGKAPPRIGVHLKTSSEAAFSRESPLDFGGGEEDGAEVNLPRVGGSGLNLPPPKAAAQPSIPAGLKPEEEVKLVGKPLMFKPLSVARKPKKKSVAKAVTASQPAPEAAAPEPPKKVSLFSIPDEPSVPDELEAEPSTETDIYSSLYKTSYTSYVPSDPSVYADYYQHERYQQQPPSQQTSSSDPQSLTAIADDLNLSAAARRELFGRGGPQATGQQVAGRVINFNMDQEYAANEELRASGEVQQYNPVRAIQPGKHSLRQLANAVQNQRDALEESFAKNRSNKKEAAGRYGW